MMIVAGEDHGRWVRGAGDPGDPVHHPEPRRVVAHPHVHPPSSSETPRRGRSGVGRAGVKTSVPGRRSRWRYRRRITRFGPEKDIAAPTNRSAGEIRLRRTHAREGMVVCAGARAFGCMLCERRIPALHRDAVHADGVRVAFPGFAWLGRESAPVEVHPQQLLVFMSCIASSGSDVVVNHIHVSVRMSEYGINRYIDVTSVFNCDLLTRS